jgi:hypothetical protein
MRLGRTDDDRQASALSLNEEFHSLHLFNNVMLWMKSFIREDFAHSTQGPCVGEWHGKPAGQGAKAADTTPGADGTRPL